MLQPLLSYFIDVTKHITLNLLLFKVVTAKDRFFFLLTKWDKRRKDLSKAIRHDWSIESLHSEAVDAEQGLLLQSLVFLLLRSALLTSLLFIIAALPRTPAQTLSLGS